MNRIGKTYEGYGRVEGSNPFDNEMTESLRENFKVTYAKRKGWNPHDLTVEQLVEIKSQPGYIQPGLIKG